MEMEMKSKSVKQKSETLIALTSGQICSSISNLSESSRVFPCQKDFHFYSNFPEFKSPIDYIASQSNSMLQQIGSSNHFPFPPHEQQLDDNACDWLGTVNDDVLQRFDESFEEFVNSRKGEDGEKSKKVVSEVVVRVVERDKKTAGGKSSVPFHIPTINRPQDEYGILVNNTNENFQHVWLERAEDGSKVIHPLEKLSVLDFVDRIIESHDPVKPPPLDSTPFKLVEEIKDLKDLAAKLRSVNEFAVDLEHNQYRSFLGLTCLMQISTRTEDFVVDTLKLRIHVGPYLREVFKDPTKRKVMHGANSDIHWLQKDFGIYVCNLFDTGQASRVLQMERYSLEHLLQHFCGVAANKQYQNADWRLRPLPEVMMRYAREDTHYLLHIYDLMKIRLLSESTDPENSEALLLEVYKRSYDVCMQLYEKELLTDTSYLHLYGVQGANFNAQQLSIVSGLYEWRDTIARAEDESTGYVLPNKTLLEIAKQVPLSTGSLRRVLKTKHPYVDRNLSAVVSIIRHSLQNASAFEAVAEKLKKDHMEKLKEGRIQGVVGREANDAVADFPEVRTAGGRGGAGSDGSQQEHEGGSVLSNNGSYTHMGKDSTMSSSRLFIGGIGINGNWSKADNDNIISDARRGYLSFPGQKNEINVAKVTVPLLKKPNRAFGAVLGSSSDSKKEKGENLLEQIRSSVSFPFYSFSHQDQQSKLSSEHAPQQQNRAPITTFSGKRSATPGMDIDSEDIILLESDQPSNDTPEDRVDAPVSKTKSEDIVILLDSDSDDEEPPDSSAGNDYPVCTSNHQEMTSKPELVILDDDDDDDDEMTSLSDLSSNFKKCSQSMDQNLTTNHDGMSEVIPLKFREEERGMVTGEDDNEKRKQDEGGFSQSRMCQAFQMNGNSSTTIR